MDSWGTDEPWSCQVMGSEADSTVESRGWSLEMLEARARRTSSRFLFFPLVGDVSCLTKLLTSLLA